MATEKRLIDANALSNAIPGISKDMKRPGAVELACLLMIVEAPTVDAVEVSRLGKLGKLMMPYTGCPRGPFGNSGEQGKGKWEPMELDAIKDVDGNRWVPVLEQDLERLKGVEVVRCKDCVSYKPYYLPCLQKNDNCGICDRYLFLSEENKFRTETDFCSYGERKDNEIPSPTGV